MKSRKDVKTLLDYYRQQRKVLPRMSQLGTNNHEEIDELIMLFTYYLDHGVIPDMSNYLEPGTHMYALWIVNKFEAYDENIEHIIRKEDF